MLNRRTFLHNTALGSLGLCLAHQSATRASARKLSKIGLQLYTLRNLTVLWRRPVRLETVIDGKLRLLGHDGREFREQALERSEYEF